MSEMSALVRDYDWRATPLGDPSSWPQSLRTTVRLLLTSRFAMWMGWGPDLTFLYNDAYGRMTLGRKHPWALGRPAREVWAEIWRDIVPRVRTVMETGEATWDEALLLFLERSGFPEETYHTFSYSPLAADDGRVEGMLCVVVEETDRVIGERRLATLRELASALAATSAESDALDAARRAIGANARDLPFTLTYLFGDDVRRAHLAAATGIEAGHAAAPEAVDADDADAPWPAAALLAGAGAVVVPAVGGSLGTLPSGAWDRPVEQALVVPISRQGQERPAGFLVAGVNPYRPLDDAYRGFVELVAGQLAASLANARAYEEERRRAESLAELDRAKTAFFSNVSHEFRTPLTLMLGPVEEALADPGASPALRERLSVAHRNALRLLKLVNSLLDFARVEAGRVEASYEPTDLAAYTAELASAFRSAVERAGLALEVDAPPLGAPLYVDRDMWEKVVLNLLSNALKHTFEGSIAVRVREESGRAVVEVSDTGVGIPADQVPRVFERFHRVPNARSRTHEGSGIGLALVQELVRRHDGRIDVASEVGKGTTFTVTLPAGSAHLPAERVRASASPRGSSVASRGVAPFVEEALRWLPGDAAPDMSEDVAPPGAPRVLLADDNADMRDYVARLLRAQGLEVDAVADGIAALAAARARTPDLVLSDVMMPGLDGFSLLRHLRADPATATLPVVLLSARAGEEARVEGLGAGADDYLVKPFAAQELIARVRTHLSLAETRRRAESALRESEARFRNMADHAPVMLWVTEVDGSCSFLNREWYAFTGQTAEQGLGFGWLDAVHPDDRAIAERAFVEANARGVAFRVEYRLRRADGEYRRAIDAAAPRYAPNGDHVGYIGSVVDIEDRARLLEAEQLARAAAEDANRAKGEFLANMSHELRTPLNAIGGYVQLVELGLHGPVTDAQRDALARVQRSQQHLLSLINDVLNVAKLEARRVEYEVEDVRVADVVAEVMPMIEPQLASRGLASAARVPDDIVARADREKLAQILLNLLSNAVKFTDRGTVSVDASGVDRVVRVRVVDTGIGIPGDKQGAIFDPFVQVHRRVGGGHEGTGLGLAISRDLARGMGGDLAVESAEGQGSAFTLTLPSAG